MTTVKGRTVFDQQALNQLYQYAMSLCGEEADAYDLLQSALEKYLKAERGRSQVLDQPAAYMRRIIRNLYIDQFRRRQALSWDVFDENVHTHVADISGQTLEQLVIDRDQLSKLWLTFNDKERELLYLWALLGHSIDEIAAELECPRGTLLARIHRLRKKLLGPSSKGVTA